MNINIFLIFIASYVISCANGAKILAVVSSASYSHQIFFQPIFKELSLRGHEITLLTTTSMKDPTLTNFTEIVYKYDNLKWKAERDLITREGKSNPLRLINGFIEFMSNVVDSQLQNEKVQQLINDKTKQFDIVVVEYLLPIAAAFGDRFNCPTVGIISLAAPSITYKNMGNPSHPVLQPDMAMSCPDTQKFYCRVVSALYTVVLDYIYYNVAVPYWNSIIYKNFGQESSSMTEIFKKIDLLLINTNSILHPVRPLVPSIVPLGPGIHIGKPKELPIKIKTFLDGATEGFIYFSLGSNVGSGSISETTRNMMVDTFRELPYKVLWKFESHFQNLPENILTMGWIPQQDVLRHKNIKLFVSQCGIQSVEEAIYNKVPILGMPLFADQYGNARMIISKEIGLSLSFESLTKEKLKNTILELIQNPKYSRQAAEVQKLVFDEPMNGLQKAIWWIEYVIRHKGAKHFKSPALDMPSYQYYLLDVISFFLIVFGIIVYLLFKSSKFMLRISKSLFIRKKLKTL